MDEWEVHLYIILLLPIHLKWTLLDWSGVLKLMLVKSTKQIILKNADY